jgi:hypothetical protein
MGSSHWAPRRSRGAQVRDENGDGRCVAPDGRWPSHVTGCAARLGRHGAARMRPSYARTSFLNAIRRGWSAAAPLRLSRCSMYDWQFPSEDTTSRVVVARPAREAVPDTANPARCCNRISSHPTSRVRAALTRARRCSWMPTRLRPRGQCDRDQSSCARRPDVRAVDEVAVDHEVVVLDAQSLAAQRADRHPGPRGAPPVEGEREPRALLCVPAAVLEGAAPALANCSPTRLSA